MPADFKPGDRVDVTDPAEGPPVDLDAIFSRREKARDHVIELCNGRPWKMSIPAQPSRDDDLVIDESLQDISSLIAEVRRLRALVDGAMP